MSKDSNISIFKDSRFGEIRTAVDENGEALFCLKDVCDALGIQNSRDVMKHMDECYVDSIYISTPVISQGKDTGKYKMVAMTFIGEPNLYRCIFQSRKKEAKEFQRWVYNDILPSIRKNGIYIAINEEESEEELIERTMSELQRRIGDLRQKVASLEAKNKYLTDIYNSNDAYSATQIAKDYGMSAIKFNKLLHDIGLQFKKGKQWFAYKKYDGYTKNVAHPYTSGDDIKLKFTTKWLPKGVELIYNKLKEINILPCCEKIS